jgi:AraC-like DNA-binding protein
MWVVRGNVPTASRQMLLPDGAFVVMFNLGSPQKVCDRQNVRRTTEYRASWVSGQQVQPLVIEQAGHYHLIGIRFRTAGAYSLFRLPLHELLGHVVELETIWGDDAVAVRESLAGQRDDAGLLRCLETWLGQRLRASPPPHLVVACAALRQGRSVADTAERLGFSRKHLNDEFNRRVGIPPKLYGRVQRLQRTIHSVGYRTTVDWADAAVSGGFYDQSHLVHEFRELVGLTPSEYLARRSPYLGYVNVA